MLQERWFEGFVYSVIADVKNIAVNQQERGAYVLYISIVLIGEGVLEISFNQIPPREYIYFIYIEIQPTRKVAICYKKQQ